MMCPVLIVPQGDTGRNGVFAYVGCTNMVDAMRGFNAGFAYASVIAYGKVTEDYAREQVFQRTEFQRNLVDRFMEAWAKAKVLH